MTETEDEIQNPEGNDVLAEMEHKYKLALADYQNLLRQTAKERSDLALYANEALIMDFLPVYDNLKLSLLHFSKDGPAEWKTGLEHILQQFKKALSENGVEEIKSQDEHFDSQTMEAIEMRETADKEKDNLVAEVLKGGYQLHKKVIIPARVAVYKLM